jgi:oxalate decarboxylase/phosphoglucose isomerase-like protein (cupin superfamily)
MTEAVPLGKTGYELWLEREGIPVVEGYGVDDIVELPRAPWPRTGGKGTYIKLAGMEGVTGMYVAEIPPGGALMPEKHLYEEVVYILHGRGATEIWQEGREKEKRMFEWGSGSLFSPPLNTWHRLVNGSQEPVVFMAVTNAPLVMDIYYNSDFVFNCSYNFLDRYDGKSGDFFRQGEKHIWRKDGRVDWMTNFISDVRTASLVRNDGKVAGGQHTCYEIVGNTLVGHISDWSQGRYHKAHYHGGGATLTILRGKGYVLMWPKEAGIQPYQAGREANVVTVNWKPGAVYSPPSGWFHQHFNSGAEPVRQLAIRLGSAEHPVGIHLAASRQDTLKDSDVFGGLVSVRKGGSLIEYEDEDPQIRKNFEAAIRGEGVECQMPNVA